MAYTVKDHGQWEKYVPNPLPKWAVGLPDGRSVMFMRRVSDGVDWYEYRNAGTNFQAGSVLSCTLLNPSDGIETLKAVVRDVSQLTPAGQRVIEIFGFDPADDKPWNTLAWMTYDPIAKTLGPPAPDPVLSVKDYQFAGQAAAEGIISSDDALQWVTVGKVPQVLIDAVKANVTDPERQGRVLLFLAGTTIYPRNHELTPILAASFGKDTPEKLDAFFAAAAKR